MSDPRPSWFRFPQGDRPGDRDVPQCALDIEELEERDDEPREPLTIWEGLDAFRERNNRNRRIQR